MRDDPGDFVILLQEGMIEVSVTSAHGRKSVLAHMGPGELLGEVSVLDNAPRSADAVALKSCDTIAISRSVFLAFLSQTPDAMTQMLETLCARIRNASDMFETQALTSAPARLARCLLLLARKWGDEANGTVTITQKFSQSELGALAGLARENVNRYIRQWAADGMLRFDRGTIEILDLNALTAESDAAET